MEDDLDELPVSIVFMNLLCVVRRAHTTIIYAVRLYTDLRLRNTFVYGMTSLF